MGGWERRRVVRLSGETRALSLCEALHDLQLLHGLPLLIDGDELQ